MIFRLTFKHATISNFIFAKYKTKKQVRSSNIQELKKYFFYSSIETISIYRLVLSSNHLMGHF